MTFNTWNIFSIILRPSVWSILVSVLFICEKNTVFYCYCLLYYVNIHKVNLIDSVVQFYILMDFSSTYFSNCFETAVKVCNYNCGFFFFSFISVDFCFMYLRKLLRGITDLTIWLYLLLLLLLTLILLLLDVIRYLHLIAM